MQEDYQKSGLSLVINPTSQNKAYAQIPFLAPYCFSFNQLELYLKIRRAHIKSRFLASLEKSEDLATQAFYAFDTQSDGAE